MDYKTFVSNLSLMKKKQLRLMVPWLLIGHDDSIYTFDFDSIECGIYHSFTIVHSRTFKQPIHPEKYAL
ncbi:hypothetical protein DERF_005930 [Dermatophagoides farinae]|uniref:Uncharacterized protein n=1 Tax=Dermatophagoides farinae TaxID=6954 RepID=A0A922I6L0_DERFA|nr:hypothetical protein DERF_005930 [Dermatophagoides farinae]